LKSQGLSKILKILDAVFVVWFDLLWCITYFNFGRGSFLIFQFDHHQVAGSTGNDQSASEWTQSHLLYGQTWVVGIRIEASNLIN
jgi:hypothetical protein